jgi:multidrug efflux system membrane fusion protein
MNRFLLILTALIAMAACGERIEPGQTSTEPVVVKGLATVVVESVAVPARYALPGTVESIDRGQLTARIPGQVARILVGKGQRVEPGDTLLTLTGETATSDLLSAESAVTAAEQHLAEAETRHKLADTTYTRFVQLHSARAITPHEFDQVQADRDTATERLGAARAALKARLAQRDSARIMAEQATVKAPYAASVSEILVDAGSTVLPGSPLLTLDRSGPFLVRVALPEKLANRHQIGDRFQVELPTLDKQLPGILSELLPTADPGSRTIMAWLTLPDDVDLKSGLFARVLMSEGSGLTTVMIPVTAVVIRGQLTGVYVVENDILHYRLVQTGTEHGERVEILSGLRAGEEIVAGDLARARHGAHLERN